MHQITDFFRIADMKKDDLFIYSISWIHHFANIAKGIVELALGKKVKDIRIAGVEKHVQARYGGKITRFDVLLKGEDSYIDVEM